MKVTFIPSYPSLGTRNVSGTKRFLVGNILVKGTSGGPAFNRDRCVVGVAMTGSDVLGRDAESIDSSFVRR